MDPTCGEGASAYAYAHPGLSNGYLPAASLATAAYRPQAKRACPCKPYAAIPAHATLRRPRFTPPLPTYRPAYHTNCLPLFLPI